MPRCSETSETLKQLATLQFKTIFVKRQTISTIKRFERQFAKCEVQFHSICAALCMNCGFLVMLLLCLCFVSFLLVSLSVIEIH